MIYSPDADLPILGTFNYDPADWAFQTVAGGNLAAAKTWAVGTYLGMAVQEACYDFIFDYLAKRGIRFEVTEEEL